MDNSIYAHLLKGIARKYWPNRQKSTFRFILRNVNKTNMHATVTDKDTQDCKQRSLF